MIISVSFALTNISALFSQFGHAFLPTFFFFHNLFIFGCFIAAGSLSQVTVSRGYSSWQCKDLLRWLLLVQSIGSRCIGLVAPLYVESS